MEKEGFSSASRNLEGMKCDSSIDKEDVGWNYFDNVKQGEDKDIVKSSVGSTNKEHTSANSTVSQGNVKSSEDVEISNEVGEMNEECMQATPPDAEILYRDKVSWNLSTENLQNREGFQNSMDKRNGNNSGPISVRNHEFILIQLFHVCCRVCWHLLIIIVYCLPMYAGSEFLK